MAADLDDLIEWLLNQVVSRGKDGVSLSELLTFVDAFYGDPEKNKSRQLGIRTSNGDGGNPQIDHGFKSQIWKSFVAHAHVLVGEDRSGNELTLTEIEALSHPSSNRPRYPEEASPRMIERDISRHLNQEILESDVEDPSSPSTQLLEQLRTQTLTAQPRIYVSQERIQKNKNLSVGNSPGTVVAGVALINASQDKHGSLNVNTNVPSRRRGRPPKARPSIPPFISSPSLSRAQQSPPTETRTPSPRKTSKVAYFTSHDESQREAGKPGVYFDIADLEKTRLGRPRKRKIALFKSERLKSFPWMKDTLGECGNRVIGNQTPGSGEHAAVSDLLQKSAPVHYTGAQKRSRDIELDSSSDKPEPKRLLLDIVRGFGSSPPTPYKSPYHSLPATTYSSPYSFDDPRSSPHTTQNGLLSLAAIDASSESPIILPANAAETSGSISNCRSALVSVQATTSKPSYQSSTSKPEAEQSSINEAFQPTMESQLEEAIKFVADLAIPPAAARLPSSRDGVAGNLCLSTDKEFLTFVPGGQIEVAPIIIQISDILESPETSTFGSNITVLGITTSGANGTEEVHQFRFLPTEDACRTANVMRAKIVTAMVLSDLKTTAEIEEVEKPYTCSGCDGTWKNIEGLKYHQTKSKTLCNPHYKPRKVSASPIYQDTPNRATTALEVSDEDGVLLSQNTSLPDATRRDQVTKERHANPVELVAAVNKFKDARSDPELQRGKEIIMDLLDANEQIFPGETSLWFAFVAASLRKSPDAGLPSFGDCCTALDLLADTGRIRKVQFSFKDKTGLMKMRTIITGYDVDPTSVMVTMMKENIKTAFPSYHVPAGFAPPNVVQSMLEERQNRLSFEDNAQKVNKVGPILRAHSPATERGPDVRTPTLNETSPSKITRSGRISRKPQRLEQEISKFHSQDLGESISKEEEDSYTESSLYRVSISRLPNIDAHSQGKRRRSKAFRRDVQGPDPIHGMETLVADHQTPPPRTIEDELQEDTDTDRPQPKRKKTEGRLAQAGLDSKPTWQPASTYLQRKNGAWGIPTPPRLIRKYALRHSLPEPITYMQNFGDSSWSFRPYGHGVRPIHARPTKRAEGQTAYLTRIQHGFRPVKMPNGDLFIPSTTSDKEMVHASKPVIEGASQQARPVGQKRKVKPRISNSTETQGLVHGPIPESALSIGNISRHEVFTSNSSRTGKDSIKVVKRQSFATFEELSIKSTNPQLIPKDGYPTERLSNSSLPNLVVDDIHNNAPYAPRGPENEVTRSQGSFAGDKSRDLVQSIPLAQYRMTSRRLTALPADLEGVEEFLADHPDLKVEVSVDHQHNVRRRTREGAISPDTEYRLMVAIVVIRTLTGGLDKQIDWVLVSRLFPDLPMNAVSKRWPIVCTKFKQIIERLGTDFQEFFLEAYERGDVRSIDYDHLVDYDWNGLVDLVLERVEINPSKTAVHRLPASRDTLEQLFTTNNADNGKAWRDDYFGLLPAAYKRLEFAGSEQYTTEISQDRLPNLEIDPLTVAKSWARANTLTPPESYNKDFAARKLATMGKGILAAATSSLFDSKVLMQRNKGRPTPNRGVEITDTFASALRKHLDETHLTQAASFKASLDAKFRASEVIMVEWAAKDGDVLAMTNLQAHGRIKLEPRGVPMNRFGLTGGGYQTKRMDKANLRFDMQILPTASYIYDTDLPILSVLTSHSAPPHGPAGAIPVWFDISENLLPAMWKKVLCVVLATIALRPGVLITELVRIFIPALEEWELRVLIEWGIRIGALTVLREGHEGWNVAEWWWVIGGRA